jgi:hypothetical protein
MIKDMNGEKMRRKLARKQRMRRMKERNKG